MSYQSVSRALQSILPSYLGLLKAAKVELVSSIQASVHVVVASELGEMPSTLGSIRGFVLSRPAETSSSPPISLVPVAKDLLPKPQYLPPSRRR